MKLYRDKERKEEIDVLDLGIVQAGESKRYMFYLFNDTEADVLELNFSVNSVEVKIEEAPKSLGANKVGELILEYKPSITLKAGLKATLSYTGQELYKPKL